MLNSKSINSITRNNLVQGLNIFTILNNEIATIKNNHVNDDINGFNFVKFVGRNNVFTNGYYYFYFAFAYYYYQLCNFLNNQQINDIVLI